MRTIFKSADQSDPVDRGLPSETSSLKIKRSRFLLTPAFIFMSMGEVLLAVEQVY
jgi:hypothetical protein